VEASSQKCEVVELLPRQIFAGSEVMRKERPMQMNPHAELFLQNVVAIITGIRLYSLIVTAILLSRCSTTLLGPINVV
jgi:hypothetical protein